MSKRALSPSSLPSCTLSSPSSSRSRRRCQRFQLLHALPASLLSQVCSFLSVYQVMSILRSTCHALYGSITADCLLQSHLVITSRSLSSLVASTSSTRALISRIPSLTILFQLEQGWEASLMAMLHLHALRCPTDASRFLLSHLSSLRFVFEELQHYQSPPQLLQSCLLSAMQLLAADARSPAFVVSTLTTAP